MQSKYQAAGVAEAISRVWLTHMLHLGCYMGQTRVLLIGATCENGDDSGSLARLMSQFPTLFSGPLDWQKETVNL